MLFPGISRYQHSEYEFLPHLCFTWESTLKFIKNCPGMQDVPDSSNCFQWLYGLENDEPMGTSETLPGVDLYFPSKKFCTQGNLFSAHIPRSFGPPLSPEQVKALYATLNEMNGHYNIPKDASDEMVMYSAFRDTYGNEPEEGVTYPQCLGPNDPAFYFRSMSLVEGFDFIKKHAPRSRL